MEATKTVRAGPLAAGRGLIQPGDEIALGAPNNCLLVP